MGGRGASGNRAVVKASGKTENLAQLNDAKREGYRLGAKYYEYTDNQGNIQKGETGRDSGGTYKAQYSEQVANYAKMSTKALEAERTRLKGISDENYQKFTRSAASRSGTMVSSFTNADNQIKMINQVLRRRR